MTSVRTAIQDFSLANELYVNAQIDVYTVLNGGKTNTLANLYANISGPALLSNPQILDSKGKFRQPVYIDEPVIISVSGLGNVPDHDTGVINLPINKKDFQAVLIPFVSNKNWELLDFGYGCIIDSVITKTGVGTCTVTILINGVPLGGGSNAATTVKQIVNHASDNIISEDDDVTIAISNSAGCQDLSINIKLTRT